MRFKKTTKLTIIHSWDEIPEFASEDEERDWWATHELSEKMYDEMKPEPTPPGTLVFALKKAKSKRK